MVSVETLTGAQLRNLDSLGRDTFRYFWDLSNPANGLVPDSTKQGAPSSAAGSRGGMRPGGRGQCSGRSDTDRAETGT